MPPFCLIKGRKRGSQIRKKHKKKNSFSYKPSGARTAGAISAVLKPFN